MTGENNEWGDFSWTGKDPNSSLAFSAIMVDMDYDKTSGIKLRSGRFFSKKFVTDSNAVVLNDAAVKLMGLKNPVGSSIKFGKEDVTVIGVIENVLMQDPLSLVVPAVMLYRSYFVSGIHPSKAGSDMLRGLAAIQPDVEKYNPAYPFEYSFTDEEFNKNSGMKTRWAGCPPFSRYLVVIISCLGLFVWRLLWQSAARKR
jgi:hypothetical protein